MRTCLMQSIKALLQFAVFVTGMVIAYLLFSLISNFCVLLMPEPQAQPQRSFHGFLHTIAYIQILGLLIMSLYELGLVYMLRFLCRLEHIQERAIMGLKNNPPLRVNLS